MIYFYRRAGDMRTCETRLESNGDGYELIVSDGADSRTEHYEVPRELGDREVELRQRLFAHGWRAVDPFDEEDPDGAGDE